MMLKMNFNFNFKDIPFAAGQSMCDLTNSCDSHHTEKTRERMDFRRFTRTQPPIEAVGGYQRGPRANPFILTGANASGTIVSS
jgi:hypothetical protein